MTVSADASGAMISGGSCDLCGRTGLTWGDVTFGHPRPGQADQRRTCQRSIPRVSTRSFDAGTGYQANLARFPGDPTAYVDSPLGRKKLEDQRLREGWSDRADHGPDKRDTRRESNRAAAADFARAAVEALRTGSEAPLARFPRAEDATPGEGDD